MKKCEICQRKLWFWQKQYSGYHNKCWSELEDQHLENLQLLANKPEEIYKFIEGFRNDIMFDENFRNFCFIFCLDSGMYNSYGIIYYEKCHHNFWFKNKYVSDLEQISLNNILEYGEVF